jgi:hypothetical protein
MKNIFTLAACLTIIALSGVACANLLTTPSGANSLPVQLGVASTNDVQLVAALKLLTAANAAANPTPSEAPLNALLIALTTLASAGAGWYARHTTANTAANLAAATAACLAAQQAQKPPS